MKNLPKMNLSSTGWALEQSQKPEIQSGSPIAWQILKYLDISCCMPGRTAAEKLDPKWRGAWNQAL